MSLDTFRLFIPFSELLAAIIGTIYFYKYRHTPLKYFLFLLWYITLTEFTGWYASKKNVLVFFDENGVTYNHWLYNLLYFVFFNVILYIYLNSVKKKNHKLWVKIFIICYIIISIINWSLIQSFVFEMSELPYVTGSIFLIISIIFYFIQLLKSEELKTFHKELLFWISIGFLLFHSGTIPFSLKYNDYALIPGIHNLFAIIYILSLSMYLIFTFGFIWCKKEEKIK
jgi:hypothetical protein